MKARAIKLTHATLKGPDNTETKLLVIVSSVRFFIPSVNIPGTHVAFNGSDTSLPVKESLEEIVNLINNNKGEIN